MRARRGRAYLDNSAGQQKGVPFKIYKYRAFSEAFRIQFYMSLCLREKQILANVCRLYSWTQKVDSAWIYKGLQAVAAVSAAEVPDMETTKIIDVWIGNSKKSRRVSSDITRTNLSKNRNKAEKYAKISNCLTIITVAVYIVIFLMEAAGHILGRLRQRVVLERGTCGRNFLAQLRHNSDGNGDGGVRCCFPAISVS